MDVLESRCTPLAFDLLFSADSWFTPWRREQIAAGFAAWAGVRDSFPAISETRYVIQGRAGEVIDQTPNVLPENTLRVYITRGPTVVPRALAETEPLGFSGFPVNRSPVAWSVRFSPTIEDSELLGVALHEGGHTNGLRHQAEETPPEQRTAMYPYVNATRTRLTGLDYRDLLWADHKIPPGTVITGVGVQTLGRVDGWLIYDPEVR